ncbi:DNA polymerase III subunit delta', partial [Campylobacter coli]|nr:DNA polymerase III subunit delta' [Campylobacter coli]
MFVSKIIITDDFDGIKAELLKQFHPNSLRFIPKEVASEFLIDDAKAVEKESY